MSWRGSKGFTLIELLIVVAIIGIIAAIAIPNLLNAIDRGKQKRTMADMRSIATAIESYSVDNNFYPTAANIAALATAIQPVYIRMLPQADGWNAPLSYEPSSAAGGGYTIRSMGKGALVEGSPAGGRTSDFTKDIIFVDSHFTQWPEGIQQ